MEPRNAFASMDGVALQDSLDQCQPERNVIIRRSVSIFSRRGTDTPMSQASLAAHAVSTPTSPASKLMTDRQRSWMRRGSYSTRKDTKKKCSGTVLNAVPPARTIRLTPLEEEMATSPNDEIMSAIPHPSPTQLAFASPTTPLKSRAFITSNIIDSPASRKFAMERRQSTNTRIGIWMSGAAHWDEAAQSINNFAADQPILIPQHSNQMATAELTPDSTQPLLEPRSSRPQLSVLIPQQQQQQLKHTRSCPPLNHAQSSGLAHPRPQRPPVPIAPAKLVNHYAHPALVDDASAIVSPLLDSAANDVELSPPAIRPTAPVYANDGRDIRTIKPQHSRESSSGSSFAERDDLDTDASVYSPHSSATSLEAVARSSEESKRIRDAKTPPPPPSVSLTSPSKDANEESSESSGEAIDLNKPLPPSPRRFLTSTTSPFVARSGTGLGRVRSVPAAEKDRWVRQLRAQGSVNSLLTEKRDRGIDERCVQSNRMSVSEPASPTFSQAAEDLEVALGSNLKQPIYIAEEEGGEKGANVERAPTLPRRSRKREWRTRVLLHARETQTEFPVRRRSTACVRRSHEQIIVGKTLRASRSAADLTQISEATILPRDVPKGKAPLKAIIDDGFVTINVTAETAPMMSGFDDGLIVVDGPVVLRMSTDSEVSVDYDRVVAAEKVLLHTLQSLHTLTDLANTAVISKGMYCVYKKHEMHLLRTVALNHSPAGWELREWCPPFLTSRESEQLEHTPASYLRTSRYHLATLECLKQVILSNCHSFLRRETVRSLACPAGTKASQRFSDALTRIWTFCAIFGCDKSREDDLTGQIDWLKGGVLAHNQDLSATLDMNLEFDVGSVLLNPPEHFARGNKGGLSEGELYDMLEMWTCLVSLLQPLQGKVEEAREVGIFDACADDAGIMENEEILLEEWLFYLLTLGPAPILALAQAQTTSLSCAFAFAKSAGCTSWSLPACDASRKAFFKEPVTRLYEERVSTSALSRRASRDSRTNLSRKRVATLAAEIRLARQGSAYKRLPMNAMKDERSMSAAASPSSPSPPSPSSRHTSAASPESAVSSPNGTIISTAPTSVAPSPLTSPTSASSPLRSPLPPLHPLHRPHRSIPNFSSTHPHSPSAAQRSGVSPAPASSASPAATAAISSPYPPSAPSATTTPISHRRISPIIEDRVHTFNRLSYRQHSPSSSGNSRVGAGNNGSGIGIGIEEEAAGGVAENTSERAVEKVVAMGFSVSEAREALRMTDMGDGLRVDRAVSLLLRSRA